MDCLIATNKLSNSQDLADYGISFASTQRTYETNATTLLHLFHGATINHPNQFCTDQSILESAELKLKSVECNLEGSDSTLF